MQDSTQSFATSACSCWALEHLRDWMLVYQHSAAAIPPTQVPGTRSLGLTCFCCASRIADGMHHWQHWCQRSAGAGPPAVCTAPDPAHAHGCWPLACCRCAGGGQGHPAPHEGEAEWSHVLRTGHWACVAWHVRIGVCGPAGEGQGCLTAAAKLWCLCWPLAWIIEAVFAWRLSLSLATATLINLSSV